MCKDKYIKIMKNLKVGWQGKSEDNSDRKDVKNQN